MSDIAKPNFRAGKIIILAQGKRIAELEAALEAALSTAPAGDGVAGWQAMDSAPKDGTPIIGSNDDETAYICAWVPDDDQGNGCWLEYGSDVVNPSRWMPLPLSASTAGGGK